MTNTCQNSKSNYTCDLDLVVYHQNEVSNYQLYYEIAETATAVSPIISKVTRVDNLGHLSGQVRTNLSTTLSFQMDSACISCHTNTHLKGHISAVTQPKRFFLDI